MRDRGRIIRITMTLLATAALLVYFGVESWRYFADPFTTALAYPAVMEDSLELSGYVIREELILPGAGDGYLRTERTEGERVSAGGTVALVYAGQADLDRQGEIDSLTGWLAELRDAKTAAMSGQTASRLDSRVYNALTDYRASLASKRLEQAESAGEELRALVPRRTVLPEDAAELEESIAAAEARLETLNAGTGPDVRQVTAPQAGLYSGTVDGYETVLTPSMLRDLKPSDLAAPEAADLPESTVGKLVLGKYWYYAAAVPAADADILRNHRGEELRLRFPRGVERDFPVTLESVSREEYGLAAVVLRGESYLSEVTQFRQQSAQIVTGTAEGLRVPKEALRMNGSGVTGLYCVVGNQARFKPVNVTYHGEDFLLVQAANQPNQENLRIRAGDEVIVQGGGLEDGKVLAEVF